MAIVDLNPAFVSLKGRIGRIVHYNRLGIQCARAYVIPRNPDTISQRLNRSAFADAVKSWQELSPDDKTFFNKRARRRGLRGYNLFISEYLRGKVLCKKWVLPHMLHNCKTPCSSPLRSGSVSPSVMNLSRDFNVTPRILSGESG